MTILKKNKIKKCMHCVYKRNCVICTPSIACIHKKRRRCCKKCKETKLTPIKITYPKYNIKSLIIEKRKII